MTQTRGTGAGPRFLGATTCSSSLCHGGGSVERFAYTVWQKFDPHHQAAGTLSGTRATHIAQGLALSEAATSPRCTVCHAPPANVAEKRLPAGLDVRAEGVSCESCHGPAQNWIRSHTRRDLAHAQTVDEPRHWVDAGEYFGPQAWLTGQAVALREMSWNLGKEAAAAPDAHGPRRVVTAARLPPGPQDVGG